MKRKRLLINICFILSSALLISGCSLTNSPEIKDFEVSVTSIDPLPVKEVIVPDVSEPEPEPEPEPDPIAEKIQTMTLEEKVCQMMIVTQEQLLLSGETITDPVGVKEALIKWPVGGIVYFGKNIITPEQTLSMISKAKDSYRENTGLLLFTCLDEEGGTVSRIGRNDAFDATWIKAAKYVESVEEAKETGEIIGEFLNRYGINLNFAPCADVLTNPSNEAIGTRAYSDDPLIVSDYAHAFSDGLHEYNVLSTYKHFPGHGGTSTDTHDGFCFVDKTYEDLLDGELVPFLHAEENNIDAIMVAHISLPQVTGDDLPCTLSYEMITNVLRGEFGYNGIIITDALNMGAVTAYEDAAVLAIMAGSDMILMPDGIEETKNELVEAVSSGLLSEERIDESVYRILTAKDKINP